MGSDAPFAAEVHSFLRGKIKRQSPQRLSAILDLETEVYQRRNGIHSHHLTAGNPRLHMRQPAQPGTRYRYYVSRALLHMPTVLAKIESSFDVAWLIPAFRQMSATGTPSAPCFKINAFCASENISAESSKSSCLTAQGVCYLEAGIAGIRQRVPGSLGM